MHDRAHLGLRADDQPFGGSTASAAVYYASRTVAANIRRNTWSGMAAFCRVTVTVASSRSVLPNRKRCRSLLLCHAHARRKFFELADIEKGSGSQKPANLPDRVGGRQAVFDALFDIERQINGLSAAERLAMRRGKEQAAIR